VLSEDFAEQLAAGMEALMRDLGKPSSSGEDAAAQASWEKILIAGMEEASRGGIDLFDAPDSAAPGKAPAGPARVEDPPPNVDEFQKKILEAMQKLKTSEDNLQVRTQEISISFIRSSRYRQSDSSNPSDPLAKLLADLDLGALDDADGQGASEGDFQTMVEGMMTQLMSKDILYDPLKELQEKVSSLDHN
jgi:peroxin-19